MHDFDEVMKAAKKQAGTVSRPQLLTAGIGACAIKRAVKSKLLVTMHRGVYRLPGAPVTPDLRQWAALLWAGDDGVLSHLTAAWLWKLDGLGRKAPFVVDISIPAKQILSEAPNLRVHRVKVLDPVKDFGTLHGFRCTSLARTLVDLSSVLGANELEQAYDSAMRRSHENRAAVLETLKRVGVRNGGSTLETIAKRFELSPTDSPLEARVRIVLREAHIRPPIPQLVITDAFEDQIGVFDFAWPERMVVIFVDGWETHSTREAFEKDRRQMSALVASGWKVLPVTHRRLNTDRAGFVRELVATLSM